MSNVNLILDETDAAASSTQNSSINSFQQEYDEAGLYQITVTSGSLTDVVFYGRLSSAHTWTAVATSGAVAASVASIGGIVASLTIMPLMFARATVNAEATFKVSIQE